MPYINLNGRLTEVTQEQFDLYNLGQGSNPAAGGTVTQLDNTQTILNQNTTNNTPGQQLPVSAQNVAKQAPTLDQQLAAVNAAQVANGGPDATAASNDPAVQAETRRIQEATGQIPTNSAPQTLDEQLAAVNAAQVENGGPDATAASNDPAVQEEIIRIQEATGQRPTNSAPQTLDEQLAAVNAAQVANGGPDATTASPAAVDQNDTGYPTGAAASTTTPSLTANTGVEAGTSVTNLVAQARNQQALRSLRQDKAQSSDWRVRLRLAPNATYLYNDPNGAGILDPLSSKTGTDGVIFPYTPAIETAYKANYESYDLTHSNYRGYFYRGSYVDAVNLRCTFTAQDTQEANYLLAVIHFFRSVTKMFYGQDSQRGSPPPLVFLSGLGDYQFNEHPSVVTQFNYTLPPDVDYIRASTTLNSNTNLLDNRTRTSIPGNPLSYGINRLLNSGLFTGAIPSTLTKSNLPVGEPTYVPTKMEISISLLPIQSRQQVSTQFSLKGFANGNQLKGGFW